MNSVPPQHPWHAQLRSGNRDSLFKSDLHFGCCNRAPTLIVNPATVVVEHGRHRADASWRVYALAHAGLDVFKLWFRYGLWVSESRRVGVRKRHVNEGHVVVQHEQLGQPRHIE